MQPLNDAEQIFFDEIREKKKDTALLRAATQHKRLGKGKVKFATDLMSRSEKLKHTKAGKVMTTNMYEDILPYAEFENLEDYEKRNRLSYLRSVKSNKEIMQAMGIGNAQYYKIVKELGLPTSPRGGKSDKPRKAAVKRTAPESTGAAALTSQLELVEKPTQPQKIIIDGLHLEFNGTYSAEQIIKQLLKFGALLEDEENKYYIELRLQEKQPN
jgi:hypothetical protein